MTEILEWINRIVWGIPALILVIIVGFYLSFKTGFAQIRLFPHAVRSFIQRFRVHNSDPNQVSSYQAVCTALAATVGTGNLAGVAGAIAIGGPGSIFWMWICGILGMATKFAEATLSVQFRTKDNAGTYVGGPMYMIRNGLGVKYRYLAVLYCAFGAIASFGIGNATQVNTVVTSIDSIFKLTGLTLPMSIKLILGLLLAAIVGVLLSGGAKRVGAIAERLVPAAAGLYIVFCVTVLLFRLQFLPKAFHDIVYGAFSPEAVTGGMLGSAFQALRIGASRGVFTNEAGMGTASIAHACAEVSHPVEQGFMGIIEVFLDTIVICTMTALVILCSGVPIEFGTDHGISLTLEAFSSVLGNWTEVAITASVICFAIATILGWGFYGFSCVRYLFGDQACKYYVLLHMLMVVFGAVFNTDTVWSFAELINGLMLIPNLIALVALSTKLKILTKEYKI